MDKSVLIIAFSALAVLIRFLITGGFSEVLALLIISSAYFVNKFLEKKPVESTKLETLETEVAELKNQVTNLSLAQGLKSFGKK